MHVGIVAVILVCYHVFSVIGNVEKVIFSAPASRTAIPDESINNLLLNSLDPDNKVLRTFVNASFPTTGRPKGETTWFLLRDLNPGQRHEVRICWVATQPTAFELSVFELKHVFETPELISSLSAYAYSRHDSLSPQDLEHAAHQRDRMGEAHGTSVLFLRVQAAADYFSLNETLMRDVPPVYVDLILDPYVLNFFPQSLLPTASYVVIIAITAWLLSAYIYRVLLAVAKSDGSASPVDKKTM